MYTEFFTKTTAAYTFLVRAQGPAPSQPAHGCTNKLRLKRIRRLTIISTLFPDHKEVKEKSAREANQKIYKLWKINHAL